jgi:membrane carboxypeptidase/penicillin-binding protein PbpC
LGHTCQHDIAAVHGCLWVVYWVVGDRVLYQANLNIAYFGDGAYGVESAAHHYFGTTAANLDLAQSAMLAGLVH